MTSKDYVLSTMKAYGKTAATELQTKASDMTGTELNGEKEFIPSFNAACEKMNMMERKAGRTDGFVCRSTAGRVVRLIQNYDSAIYTQEPEELPAQWGFVWSDDPAHALPFVAISTSPYMTGNCCTEDGAVHRAKMDNLTAAPSAYPQGWEAVT